MCPCCSVLAPPSAQCSIHQAATLLASTTN
uniref:Uncharacterized protein n=1 Tax=Arundo donax TaxID=35708 RepID=A0A0A8ZCW4_ARUDO